MQPLTTKKILTLKKIQEAALKLEGTDGKENLYKLSSEDKMLVEKLINMNIQSVKNLKRSRTYKGCHQREMQEDLRKFNMKIHEEITSGITVKQFRKKLE